MEIPQARRTYQIPALQFSLLIPKPNFEMLNPDIRKLLPVEPFTKKSGQTVEEECTICTSIFMEKELLLTLPCFHKFHLPCIDPWFQKSKKCPICQLNIESVFKIQEPVRKV